MNSNILFTEEPLVVNKPLAKLIGLNESIVLQQIEYWLRINKRTKNNFRDNRYWTYNSMPKWHEENFEFWSFDTCKRTFAKLEKMGLLITSNKYNEYKYDRTKWYTIDYDLLNELVKKAREASNTNISAKCTEASVQNAPKEKGNLHSTIPETSQRLLDDDEDANFSEQETQEKQIFKLYDESAPKPLNAIQKKRLLELIKLNGIERIKEVLEFALLKATSNPLSFMETILEDMELTQASDLKTYIAIRKAEARRKTAPKDQKSTSSSSKTAKDYEKDKELWYWLNIDTQEGR